MMSIRKSTDVSHCLPVSAVDSLPDAAAEYQTTAESIHLAGARDIVISGKAFQIGPGTAAEACILLDHCTNITVTSCIFVDVPCKGIYIRNSRNIRLLGNWFRRLGSDNPRLGIEIYRASNVTIKGNRIEQVESGAYILESTAIEFAENYVVDVLGPPPRGQMIQLDKVFGEGNRILRNIAINQWNNSHPEDVVSVYKSSGTAHSPISIVGNWIMGDPAVGSQDKSISGSGILLGDGGGAHIICSNNTLVSPAQVGIGVASGGNILVASNLVIGRKSNRSNVGIYVWNQVPMSGGTVLIKGNVVAWENSDGGNNSFWKGPAKYGGKFDFREVVLQRNTWDAWTDIEQSTPVPPAIRVFPMPMERNDCGPNNSIKSIF